MPALQAGARLLPAADTQRGGFCEHQPREPLRILRMAQHRQQHPRTVFLHLHRSGKHVQRAFLQSAVHHVTEHLGRHIVHIGFQDGDGLLWN